MDLVWDRILVDHKFQDSVSTTSGRRCPARWLAVQKHSLALHVDLDIFEFSVPTPVIAKAARHNAAMWWKLLDKFFHQFVRITLHFGCMTYLDGWVGWQIDACVCLCVSVIAQWLTINHQSLAIINHGRPSLTMVNSCEILRRCQVTGQSVSCHSLGAPGHMIRVLALANLSASIHNCILVHTCVRMYTYVSHSAHICEYGCWNAKHIKQELFHL